MTDTASPIAYATPTASPGSRTWTTAAITFAGLALIFFGGCFMIGVLIQLWPALVFGSQLTKVWTTPDYVFHGVLYTLAATCFLAGGMLLYRGVRALLRVLADR